MKFQTAVNKLKKIANGQYCALQYQAAFYNSGKSTQECSVYVEGTSWYSEATWVHAFKALERNLALNTANDAEAPEDEL